MAAGTDTLPFPIYGAKYRVVLPIFDADGDLVTGAASDTPDTEVSTDCGTFADSAELVEIATNSGMYYKDFTAAEMTGSVVAAIFKTATAGTKTTPLVLYPRRLPSIRDNTCQAPSAIETKCKLDASASAKDDFYNGCYVMLNANTGAGQARLIIDYDGGTTECTVWPNWATDPDNTTTFSILVPENAIVPGWAGVQVADPATAGVPETDMTHILGHLLTQTGTQLADGFEKFFNVSSPTGTVNSIPDAVAGAAGGLFIAGTNAETTVTTAINANLIGNITGNLSGSVGTLGGLAAASAAKLDDILDGTGGTGLKLSTLEVTGTTTLTGAVSLGSTLGITGAVTLSSTLGVGAVTFASAAITGALSVGTTTTLTGAVSLGSTLAVTGTTTFTGAVSLGSTLGVTGASTFTGGIVADITGNVSGSVGSVTAEVTANAVKISGDATAANNLELQYDTTGLAGDTFPATQAQIANITNTGSAVSTTAASYTLTTGTQSSGTYSSTAALDSTNHEHTDDGGAMELYYQFAIGSGIPTSVTVTGYMNGNNDDLSVWGYDWVATAWVQIGTLEGKAASSNEVNSYEMFTNMVGTAANEGVVRVRFYAASGLGSATLAVDQIFCSFSRGNEGYDGGAIWVDTTYSNTNTIVGIDGTARNPVSTIAAANTLAASTNLNRFEIAPGSAITFAASQDDQIFNGHDWTLALGGRSISGSYITGAAVSGISSGANPPTFTDCTISTTTVPPCEMRRCGLTSTITGASAGSYHFNGCFSEVAGAGTPAFDFEDAAENKNVNFRHYSGGIEIKNMGQAASTDTMSLEGWGQLVLASTCDPTSNPTIALRGSFTITDNVAGGFVTGGGVISDDARYDVAQINTECDTALTEWGKTGFSLVSTGLDAVTAWTTTITGNITGNLSGSVGSVTGAVGSVAGNVDGSVASVVGAVGSVTGAVGSVTGAVGSVTGTVGSVAGNVDGSVASVVGAVGSVTGAVGSLTGHTVQTGDTYALAAGATGFAAIDAVVDSILLQTGTNGVVVAAASKTGYTLSAAGLDSISMTMPTGLATNYRETQLQNWMRWYYRATMTVSTLTTYASDAVTVVTQQTLADDLTTQDMGEAS